MNILSSILPGLRELRTPLACGYVTLAAIWIYATFGPKNNVFIHTFSRPASEAGKLWGDALVLAAISTGAYILGILLTSLMDLATAINALILRALSRAVIFLAISIPTVPIVAIIGYRRMSKWEVVQEQLVAARLVAVNYQKKVAKFLSFPSPNQATELRMRISAELIERALNSDAAVEAFAKRLDAIQGGILQDRLSLYHTNKENNPAWDGQKFVEVALEDRIFQRDNFAPAKLATMITDLSSQGYRNDVWRLAVSSVGIDRLLVRDLEELPAQLAVQAPPAFERWDRLRAEGEFRTGIAWGLLLFCMALAATHLTSWGLLFIYFPVLQILLQDASRKYADAEIQLLQALSSGVVKGVRMAEWIKDWTKGIGSDVQADKAQ